VGRWRRSQNIQGGFLVLLPFSLKYFEIGFVVYFVKCRPPYPSNHGNGSEHMRGSQRKPCGENDHFVEDVCEHTSKHDLLQSNNKKAKPQLRTIPYFELGTLQPPEYNFLDLNCAQLLRSSNTFVVGSAPIV
jgi:hypothetical protein